jgi:osmotically-inducible protein OsmY
MLRYNNTYPDRTFTARAAHINEYIYGSPFMGQKNLLDDAGYRGKGPRNYKRSDNNILEEVCDLLMDDSAVDASNIEVSVQEGQVYLSGSVDDREMKRRAERILDQVSGIKDIRNLLLLKDTKMH